MNKMIYYFPDIECLEIKTGDLLSTSNPNAIESLIIFDLVEE